MLTLNKHSRYPQAPAQPIASICIVVRRAIVAGASALVVISALAEDARSGTRPSNSDEIVTLSEFTVRPEAQAGYVASEVMSGSRIPTKIKDLPFSINVITSEL